MDSVAADPGLPDLAGSPGHLEPLDLAGSPGHLGHLEPPDFPGLPAKAFQELQDFPDSAEVQVMAASRRMVKMFMPISM